MDVVQHVVQQVAAQGAHRERGTVGASARPVPGVVGHRVAVGGQLIVRDLDDPVDSSVSIIVADAPLTALTTLAGFSTTSWSADAGVGIPAAWGGSDGLVSSVNLTVENILLAASFEPSSISFIEKKFVSVAVVTTPVPEPETYAMLLASLGLVGFMARRRSSRV